MVNIFATSADMRKGRILYDALADKYWQQREEQYKSLQTAMKPFIEVLYRYDQGAVLDVGCGVGTSSKILSENDCLTTGIDLSRNMVKYAEKFAPKAKIRQRNFLERQLDPKYDAISMISFFHLFDLNEINRVLTQTRQLLPPGGTLFIVTPFSEISRSERLPKLDYNTTQTRYRHMWSQADLESLLNSNILIVENQYVLSGVRQKRWLHTIARHTPYQ